MPRPKIVRTKPVRGEKGRILHGREVERALGDRVDQRQPCRVCCGTRRVREKVGESTFEKECKFCDEEGYARVICGDCGEVLPMCRCVRESGYAVSTG